MKKPDPVREHTIDLLKSSHAHATFDAAVADFPPAQRGVRPKGLPYSAWELLEHIRIAQWGILEFSRDPKHISPKWPEGYWPKTPSPPSAAAWNKSVKSVRASLQAMEDLVADRKNELFTPFAHGTGQTLLREAFLVADHNAYHVGQLVLLRRLLGAWK